ncbi:MAG: alanine racemase [Elusimicrobiota bacterium]
MSLLTFDTAIGYRPTWVEISEEAFIFNLLQIKKYIGNSVQLMAVLKADAYGHGANVLAPIAIENGVDIIGVSSLEEGIALRSSGVKAPILVLAGVFPLENFSVAIEHGLTPTVASLEAAQQLVVAAKSVQQPILFHLKIDTGMGRIGVSPQGAIPLLEWIRTQSAIQLAGVYTHFSSAGEDRDVSAGQLKKFNVIKIKVKELFAHKVLFHSANSAALFSIPESLDDMVRPGIALFGESLISLPKAIQLKPVLSWFSKIIYLKRIVKGTSISYGQTWTAKKDSDIATIPVGYADGVSRKFSNRGFVLVQGVKCPIVGRVTMDHMMIDVTGVKTDIGDVVTLIGRQGDEVISASDCSSWAETISYEIFCNISKRVPRVLVS